MTAPINIRDFAAKAAVKAAACVLLVIAVSISAISVVSCLMLAEYNVYSKDGGSYADEIMDSLLEREATSIWDRLNQKSAWTEIYAQKQDLENELSIRFSKEKSNIRYAVYDMPSGTLLLGDESIDDKTARYCKIWTVSIESALQNLQLHFENGAKAYSYILQAREDPTSTLISSEWLYAKDGTVTLKVQTCPKYQCMICLALTPGLPVADKYRVTLQFVSALVRYRFVLIATAVIGFVLAVLMLNILLLGAGRKPGRKEIALCPWDDTPFEIYLLLMLPMLFLPNILMTQIEDIQLAYATNQMFHLFLISLAVVYQVIILYCILMTSIRRCRAKVFRRNTLMFRMCRCLLRFYSRQRQHKAEYGIKLFLKIVLVYLFISVVEFCFVLYFQQKLVLWLWLGIKLAICMLLALFSYSLNILDSGGRALQEGNVTTKIRTEQLLPMFRRYGETLNGISVGMKKSMDEQMRSEHMKTELITNVSHDLKTPLTSIINYVDLIKRVGLNAPESLEYLAVLDRQAVRLKKLVMDLVEASKASSGNINVEAELLDLNVMLTQAAGEYVERMQARSLEQVVEVSSLPLMVLVDPKLLWRVFDNLLYNAMLYSQKDSRVYITTECRDEKAVVVFRNISSQRLNISPQELMERFVRGDSSRNTEGSGLGLSITRSLTELQGGVFNLAIDGDLFKAILEFPIPVAQVPHE